jgi:hypothetical protein
MPPPRRALASDPNSRRINGKSFSWEECNREFMNRASYGRSNGRSVPGEDLQHMCPVLHHCVCSDEAPHDVAARPEPAGVLGALRTRHVDLEYVYPLLWESHQWEPVHLHACAHFPVCLCTCLIPCSTPLDRLTAAVT